MTVVTSKLVSPTTAVRSIHSNHVIVKMHARVCLLIYANEMASEG